MLGRKIYEIEGNQQLQEYLKQQVLKEEFKLSKLLLNTCKDETFDVRSVVDLK